MSRKSCSWAGRLFEFGCNTSLFADLVGGYSINFSVSFDWNNLGAVCVYGMVASLPQEAKAAFRQVPDEVTPFDRHAGRRSMEIQQNLICTERRKLAALLPDTSSGNRRRPSTVKNFLHRRLTQTDA